MATSKRTKATKQSAKAAVRKAATSKTPKKTARKAPGTISAAQASAALKRYAQKQQVQLEVTEKQLAELQKVIGPGGPSVGPGGGFDPRKPFQIQFIVKGKPVGDFRVASCAFWSDTCCA